jgi:hypothetical protein
MVARGRRGSEGSQRQPGLAGGWRGSNSGTQGRKVEGSAQAVGVSRVVARFREAPPESLYQGRQGVYLSPSQKKLGIGAVFSFIQSTIFTPFFLGTLMVFRDWD